MGLIAFFLPERLPRQVVYAGDRHVEIFERQNKGIVSRGRVPGAALAESDVRGWAEVAARLRREETGIVFNAAPFIYNFFEFDKLPWQKKALQDLVAWRLQKVFPENIETYDHRFFPLDRKRVFSILVKRALAERMEQLFAEARIPLIHIGNSIMEILMRLQRTKNSPDFFIENDASGCTLVFLKNRTPVYLRKFKSGSSADTVEEIGKTVQFVSANYGIEPRRYWLIDQGGQAAGQALQQDLDAGNFARLDAGQGGAPFIPGRP